MKHTSVVNCACRFQVSSSVTRRKLLGRVQPGDYLFGRNIKTPEQLRKLVDDLRNLSLVEPIILSIRKWRVSRLSLDWK